MSKLNTILRIAEIFIFTWQIVISNFRLNVALEMTGTQKS